MNPDQGRAWKLVIHGGAGVLRREDMTTELDRIEGAAAEGVIRSPSFRSA